MEYRPVINQPSASLNLQILIIFTNLFIRYFVIDRKLNQSVRGKESLCFT